ncbi:MAG TPA: chemotaxis protein CheV [Epulopiscium sp.]|nr:chemotaxis protein CheV [Candidatus Epulonipiscium sp.]
MEPNILLETGTGEVEILEFIINGKHYGINVIKVKEVIEIDNLTKLPLTHPSVAGLTLARGEVLTLISLKYVLDQEDNVKNDSNVIVCEFNQTKVGFIFDDIVGIHRISWKDIKKPEHMSSNQLVIGNVVFEGKIILLLDFEKIVTDINPNVGITEERMSEITIRDRSKVKLILADDSALIRELIKNTLTAAGYKDMKFFNDGEEALTYLSNLANEKKEKFTEDAHIMITDIEMPQMDGHTLTRAIKNHNVLSTLPVIIFSSLITEDLKHKGIAVGADAQMSKPEIGQLVKMIDKFTIDLK